MSEMQAEQRSAVVFGARNLGRAVIELLVSDGWAVTGVARSRSALTGVSASGALALNADVTDPASVYDALEQAAAAHGGVDLVVNAAAAYAASAPAAARSPRPTSTASTRGRRLPPAQRSRSCPPAAGSRSRRAGQPRWCRSPAARRGARCRGAAFGRPDRSACARSRTRPRSSCAGIQVVLLIVDAGIQPLDGSVRGGVSPEALADPRRIADAVLFLANQDARSATHELQLTPLAETWTP